MTFGLTITNNNISVAELNEFGVVPPNIQYTFKLETIENRNGNGILHLHIYKEGIISNLIVGPWSIKSPIKLPFDFKGYRARLDIIDMKREVREVETPQDGRTLFDNRGANYSFYIKEAYIKLKEMSRFKNWEHMDLVTEKQKLQKEHQEITYKLQEVETKIRGYESMIDVFNLKN